MRDKFTKEISVGTVKRLKRTIDEVCDREISPKELVSKVYGAVDFYYKKEVAPKASCKKGCSWCCRVPVDVSAVEVQYIYETTGISPTDERNVIEGTKQADRSKCPFLSGGSCSIYESRPFHCRIFASLDGAENCVDGNTQHLITTHESNKGLVILHDILLDASGRYDVARFADIRDWYRTTTKTGDENEKS